MTTINFLKDNEIELFDSPPRFTEEARNRFLVLPDNEVKFRKTETKIGYILQEGYFMSKKKFFLPEHFHTEDVKFVRKLLGIKNRVAISKDYNKITYSIHKKFILNKNGYHSFSDSKDIFEKEASELVKTSLRPREIFESLLDFLEEKRIEVPRYYVFAEVITQSLNLFENNLIGIIDRTLYGSNMTDEQLLDKYKVVVRELTDNRQSLRRAALLGGCSLGTAQKIRKIIEKRT